MIIVPATAEDVRNRSAVRHRDCGGVIVAEANALTYRCATCGLKWSLSSVKVMSDQDAASRFVLHLPEDQVAYKMVDVQDGTILYSSLRAYAKPQNSSLSTFPDLYSDLSNDF